ERNSSCINKLIFNDSDVEMYLGEFDAPWEELGEQL
ncbi:hypothetical protein A2U01_0079398, partial [Trifolium medium]|nr:hypothetical protein [Trifolium medium]